MASDFNEDLNDGQLDTIFLLKNNNSLTDVQDAPMMNLHTVMLMKTNKYILCQANWEYVFFKNIWKTIHSGVIDNWNFDVKI